MEFRNIIIAFYVIPCLLLRFYYPDELKVVTTGEAKKEFFFLHLDIFFCTLGTDEENEEKQKRTTPSLKVSHVVGANPQRRLTIGQAAQIRLNKFCLVVIEIGKGVWS